MSLFNYLEIEGGKELCYRFLEGLLNWQDSFVFEEIGMSKDVDFFIKTISRKDLPVLKRYKIRGVFYKGLVCESNSIESTVISSFTTSYQIALRFADVETSNESITLERIIVKQKSRGFDLNRLISDAKKWIVTSERFLISKGYFNSEEVLDFFYEDEKEVLCSFDLEKINIVSREYVQKIIEKEVV